MDDRETFSWSPGAVQVAAGAGALLVGGVLAAVASGVAWGTIDDGGAFSIHLKEAQAAIPDQGSFSFDWTNGIFDDADGIGMVRAAGTIHLVGLITVFIGAATVGASVVFRGISLTALGSSLSGIAAVLLSLSAVLFPIGAERMRPWFQEQSGVAAEIDWGAGLVVAVLSAALALGGVGTAYLAIRHGDVS